MQNVSAAKTEGTTVRSTYEELGLLNSAIDFVIPVYENMPETVCQEPVQAGIITQNIKIKGTNVNVRSGASTTTSVIATVNTGDIVIFEGIHALNPMVTGDFDCTTKVYISVRTRLVNDDGSVLHPRRIRLMRRLLRDSLFRGKDYNYIFSYFESVSHGEDKYIMPFKQVSEFDIDTFHNYEASVYKGYLLNNLIEAKDTLKGNLEYEEIVSFLSELDDIDSNLVPNSSLVREFIGGSSFNY